MKTVRKYTVVILLWKYSEKPRCSVFSGEEVRKSQFPCCIWTVVSTWRPTAVR